MFSSVGSRNAYFPTAPFYTIKYSIINTNVQHISATLKRFAPNHAAMIPTIKLISPEVFDMVACNMAGKVITDSVT